MASLLIELASVYLVAQISIRQNTKNLKDLWKIKRELMNIKIESKLRTSQKIRKLHEKRFKSRQSNLTKTSNK